MCAIHDVTIHRQNERSLAAARERAEAATASKSRLLAAASHDLRQPLQSLGLYLAALTRHMEEPTQRRIGAKMRESLACMAGLLDALLDVSELDRGDVVVQQSDFPLRPLLDRVVNNHIQQARSKGLTLCVEGADCVVRSDPSLLERIIDNFVGNAVRYTNEGGVRIQCRCHGEAGRIEVCDTGIGIPADALTRIFDEYYQLDNPHRDRRKGLGLGLSIAGHIARLLEHRLDVSSEPGVGSKFAVEVPIDIRSVAQTKTEEVASMTQQDKRDVARPVVLFVDDDPAVVDATAMFFRSAGIDAHCATDCTGALAKLSAGLRPDIIVSDFWLPEHNGTELVRRVRQAVARMLPAIIMTGDTSDPAISSGQLANSRTVHKPVDAQRLIDMIDVMTRDGGAGSGLRDAPA
jgi:two-component system CheB/CheR fusion protein